MNLDDMLQQVGDWGRYQLLLVPLVCLPLCFPAGFQMYSQVFFTMTPDHWCKVPELLQTNLTAEERKKLSIPVENSGYSKCSYYDLNYTDLLLNHSLDASGPPPDETRIVPCKFGWEFGDDSVSSSIVTQLDLVCSKAILPVVGLSARSFGGVIGLFVYGYLSDRFGRKLTYFVSLLISIIGGIITTLAPEIISFSVFSIIAGMAFPAMYVTAAVICLELVAPSKRTLMAFSANISQVLGFISFSGAAYLFRDWHHLAYFVYLPFLLYFFYILVLPESLRWLLSKGKVEEAEKILRKIASSNGRLLVEDVWTRFRVSVKETYEQQKNLRSGQKVTISSLFKTPNMRMKTLIISFSWGVIDTVYVGLSFYGPAMGSDAYLGFFLATVVEIPGYVLTLFLMDRLGRRVLLCSYMIVGGVAAISTAMLPADAATATLVLFLVAKLAIASSTMVILQFSSELYPTEVRGIGMSLSSDIGGIGMTIIPFVNYLGSEQLYLPIAVMGTLALVGGVASLRLPETLNAKLPETVEDGENFGKDFDWQLQITGCASGRAAGRNRGIPVEALSGLLQNFTLIQHLVDQSPDTPIPSQRNAETSADNTVAMVSAVPTKRPVTTENRFKGESCWL